MKPEIPQDPDLSNLSNPEVTTSQLEILKNSLGRLGFNITEQSQADASGSLEGDEGEDPFPTLYRKGDYLAQQEINGHTISFAFSPTIDEERFATGIYVDNVRVFTNHDNYLGEIQHGLLLAIGCATADITDPSRIPSDIITETRSKITDAFSPEA